MAAQLPCTHGHSGEERTARREGLFDETRNLRGGRVLSVVGCGCCGCEEATRRNRHFLGEAAPVSKRLFGPPLARVLELLLEDRHGRLVDRLQDDVRGHERELRVAEADDLARVRPVVGLGEEGRRARPAVAEKEVAGPGGGDGTFFYRLPTANMASPTGHVCKNSTCHWPEREAARRRAAAAAAARLLEHDLDRAALRRRGVGRLKIVVRRGCRRQARGARGSRNKMRAKRQSRFGEGRRQARGTRGSAEQNPI